MDRKAALAAYRERKQEWQVYAVEIGAQSWVGVAPDLGAVRNRLGFTLRQGSAPVPGMQEAFNAVGAVEVRALETLDSDLGALARETEAKAARDRWCAALGARPMLR